MAAADDAGAHCNAAGIAAKLPAPKAWHDACPRPPAQCQEDWRPTVALLEVIRSATGIFTDIRPLWELGEVTNSSLWLVGQYAPGGSSTIRSVANGPAKSNCLGCQDVALVVSQRSPVLILPLRMVSSLRMHAVRTNFWGLPVAGRRW